MVATPIQTVEAGDGDVLPLLPTSHNSSSSSSELPASTELGPTKGMHLLTTSGVPALLWVACLLVHTPGGISGLQGSARILGGQASESNIRCDADLAQPQTASHMSHVSSGEARKPRPLRSRGKTATVMDRIGCLQPTTYNVCQHACMMQSKALCIYTFLLLSCSQALPCSRSFILAALITCYLPPRVGGLDQIICCMLTGVRVHFFEPA
eukprot:1142147-Pelagomonas_calceolata.AAC.1